jgi:hypothetical protein
MAMLLCQKLGIGFGYVNGIYHASLGAEFGFSAISKAARAFLSHL